MRVSDIPRLVNAMDTKLLLKKCKGCLLGALTGDCLGAPFEGEKMTTGTRLVLNEYFDKLYGPYFEIPRKNYTDDTAMTRATVDSLIEKNGLDCKDLAIKYVKAFYNDPRRGYGESVPMVFSKLRRQNFKDLYAPAYAQFDGTGSFGNGGAMRVAPLALFFQNDYNAMIDAVTKATQITHAHKSGIDGALLQAIAIQLSLQLNPENKFNVQTFCAELIEKMNIIEAVDDIRFDEDVSYVDQLHKMEQLLKSQEVSQHAVIETLGNSVSAIHSVPTAIFCFLHGMQPIDNIQTENPIRRTIQFAVSLGGDTDTIASMGGAIAGAYYGDDYFDTNVQKHCEYSEETIKDAENLFACIS